MEDKRDQHKPFRVLSLDGGGVRCIIQLAILEELERVAGPIHHCFDAIIGSSVGALVGCGVSMGFGMQESTDLFYSFVDEVFSKNVRFHKKLKRMAWWSFSKHDDDRVSQVLQAIYGKTTMQDLAVNPTMVLCYNPLQSRPEIISSDEEAYAHVPVWEACKAATSAPLYFKPKRIKTRYYSDYLLDGGLVANNPSLFGLTKGMKIMKERHGHVDLSDVMIVSLGSGKIRESTSTTIRGHINSLTTAPFFGSSEAAHHGVKDLLDDNYYRLQVELPNNLKRPDESYNIHEIHSITDDVIRHDYHDVIKQLANILVDPLPHAVTGEETAEVIDATGSSASVEDLHHILIKAGTNS